MQMADNTFVTYNVYRTNTIQNGTGINIGSILIRRVIINGQ